MYSGSKSLAGSIGTPSAAPIKTFFLISSSAVKLSKPACVHSLVWIFTIVTVPSGSFTSTPYPSLGSPSSAQSNVWLSANVTISGCTPASYITGLLRLPSAPQLYITMIPFLSYSSCWIATARYSPLGETEALVISPYTKVLLSPCKVSISLFTS